MKKIITFTICMLSANVARADYWEIITQQPGQLCWGMIAGQDDNTGHDGSSYDEYGDDFWSVQCEMPVEYIDGPARDALHACYDSTDTPTESCLIDYNASSFSLFCVAEASSNLYVEDFPCDWCRNNGDGSIYGDWSDKNSNNAIYREYINFNNDGAQCVATAATKTWGCPANYYWLSGNDSDTVCAACPSNASCSTSNGHTATFVCNIGYYKDGSNCTRCPSSGNIYGTTKSTGATSITECYIPSGGAFSDDTGSGIYTQDCYYSN